MKKLDNRKDLLLLLLLSPGVSGDVNEPIIGRTRLVKMIFLFKEEVWRNFKKGVELTEENMYQFFPWNYGPFSKEVYDDLTFFTLRGFIDVAITNQETIIESAEEWNYWLSSTGSDTESPNEYQEEEFKLTAKGVSFSSDLYSSLSDNQKKLLKEFKARISQIPLRALLRYVYTNYEDQTSKSTIKDDILK